MPQKTLGRARGWVASGWSSLSSSPANRLAAIAWVLATAGILYVVIRQPYRQANFGCYFLAGRQWIAGEPLYLGAWGGFIYSPIVAAFYSLFAFLPEPHANFIWRALSIGVLLGSVAYALDKGPFSTVAPRNRAFVFLALLPFSIGNLDRGQANPLVLALMLVSVTAATRQHWNVATLTIGIAAYFKIYPLAVGMLYCVVSPRRTIWRLLAVLVLLGLLPFALQHSDYVATEYRSWFETRAADNRLVYSINQAPLDLWFLVVRLGGLPLNQNHYRILEVIGGGAIAVFCWVARSRGWKHQRLIGGLFVFATLWMVVLGPSTEDATYLLLAPLVCIGLVQAFAFRLPPPTKVIAVTAFALLLLGVVRVHLIARTQNPFLLSCQPLAALVFIAFSVAWLRNAGMWESDPALSGSPSDPKTQLSKTLPPAQPDLSA